MLVALCLLLSMLCALLSVFSVAGVLYFSLPLFLLRYVVAFALDVCSILVVQLGTRSRSIPDKLYSCLLACPDPPRWVSVVGSQTT